MTLFLLLSAILIWNGSREMVCRISLFIVSNCDIYKYKYWLIFTMYSLIRIQMEDSPRVRDQTIKKDSVIICLSWNEIHYRVLWHRLIHAASSLNWKKMNNIKLLSKIVFFGVSSPPPPNYYPSHFSIFK